MRSSDRSNPVSPLGGTAILRGNLAPNGAVIKLQPLTSDCSSTPGPAVVFRDYNDMAARIDDEALPVDEDSVIVLQNAGPLGGPACLEWGMLPIPKKLLKRGVRDMLGFQCANERHLLWCLRAAVSPRRLSEVRWLWCATGI
jgi:dihydroxy-acid dehydratase